jgi:uncharacterized membrane protein YjgN (DUF898 family)
MANGNFTYTGKWQEFFGVCFIQWLLTMITLGFYSPWAYCKIREWMLEKTFSEGKQLTFTGRGIDLFIIYLVQIALTIVTLGIWALLQIPTHKIVEFDTVNIAFKE